MRTRFRCNKKLTRRFFSVTSRNYRDKKNFRFKKILPFHSLFFLNDSKNLHNIVRDSRDLLLELGREKRKISNVSYFVIFERNLRARCVNIFSSLFFCKISKWKLRNVNLAALQIDYWKTPRKNEKIAIKCEG